MKSLGLKIMGMVMQFKSLFQPKKTQQAQQTKVFSLIHFTVFPEKVAVLPQVFGMQKNMLQTVPGFVQASLLKGPHPAQFGILTQWTSQQALDEWKNQAREKGGKHMQAMLRGESKMVQPPYEVTRWETLVSSD